MADAAPTKSVSGALGWVRRRLNPTNIALAGVFVAACCAVAPAAVATAATASATANAGALTTAFNMASAGVHAGAPVLYEGAIAKGSAIWGAVTAPGATPV